MIVIHHPQDRVTQTVLQASVARGRPFDRRNPVKRVPRAAQEAIGSLMGGAVRVGGNG